MKIDAVVVGQRNKRNSVFCIEAKMGSPTKDLAKHKLLYAALAVAPKVPRDWDIVPVYIKVEKASERSVYHVCECVLPQLGSGELLSLNTVQPKSVRILALPMASS